MMRCCSKEKIASTGISPKAANVINHICPSKLSKRELEDLYFTLVQNNLELKQTINELSDKIKYQTTKLQRMLATQRAYMGTETKDCCATAKAIVQEQKLVIIDLKKANENLQDQVNNLNTKLCSTKQFLKRTPAPKRTPVGKAKFQTRLDSAKNSSTSAVQVKAVKETSTEPKSASVQSEGSSAPGTARNPKEINKNESPEIPNKLCDQNICKTQMEELQQKIVDLQEELSKAHEEYGSRIARLEMEVVDLHSENMRVRSEKALWENNLNARENEANAMRKKLAETECICEELSASLNIERSKVAELQTQIKAANMTSDAVKTIEDRLFNENTTKDPRRGSVISPRSFVINRPEQNANETKYPENIHLRESSSFIGKSANPNDVRNVDSRLDKNNVQSSDKKYKKKDNLEPELKNTPNYNSAGTSNYAPKNTVIHNDGRERKPNSGNDTISTRKADNGHRVNPDRSEGISSGGVEQQKFINLELNDKASIGKADARQISPDSNIYENIATITSTRNDNRREVNPDNNFRETGDIEARRKEHRKSVSYEDIDSIRKTDAHSEVSPDNINGNTDTRREGESPQTRHDKTGKADIRRQLSPPYNIPGDIDSRNIKRHECISHDRDKPINTRRQIGPGLSDNVFINSDVHRRGQNECVSSNDTSNTGKADSTKVSHKNENLGKSESTNANHPESTGSRRGNITPKKIDQTAIPVQEKESSTESGRIANIIDSGDTAHQRDDHQNTRSLQGKINSKIDCSCPINKNPEGGACENHVCNNFSKASQSTVDQNVPDNNRSQGVTLDRQGIYRATDIQETKYRHPSVTSRDIEKREDQQEMKDYHTATISEVEDQSTVNNENGRKGCGSSQMNKFSENESPRDMEDISNNKGQSSPNSYEENKGGRINLNRISLTESEDSPYSRQNRSKIPTDYSTEYSRQFNNPRRILPDLKSPTKTQARKPAAESFYGTDVIPEGDEKIKTTPVMSQLVNKSNESSCFCSEQCQCVNSFKTMASTPAHASCGIANASSSTPVTRVNTGISTPEPSRLVNAATEADRTNKATSLVETSEQSAANTWTPKTPDDSGFTEASCSGASEKEKGLKKMNQELEKKVAEMQAQLDELKSHMLSRKNTYTVFKDDATSINNSMKPENETRKEATAASQTPNEEVMPEGYELKGDYKHVYLKIPRKGYVMIKQDPGGEEGNISKEYHSTTFHDNANCESTCGKEGLSCTKECMLKNKKNNEQKYFEAKKDSQRKDYDNWYQIPGPLPVNYDDKTSQPRKIRPDSTGTESFKSPKDKQPQENDKTSRGVPTYAVHQFDDNYCETDVNSQNIHFYNGRGGEGTGVRQNIFHKKTEMTPMNHTQNTGMKDTSANPNAHLAQVGNAPYAKEVPIIPNPRYTRTWEEESIKEPSNSKQAQYIKNPNYPEQQTDYMDTMTSSDKPTSPTTPTEDTSKSTKTIPVRCGCRAAKKTPIKCICPPLTEYTTNIVRTSAIPITLPKYQTSKYQTYDASKTNTENAVSSNIPPYNLQTKNNITPNVDAVNGQNLNNTRTGTENKEITGGPPFESLIDNIERSEKTVEKNRPTEFEESTLRRNVKERAMEKDGLKSTATVLEKARLFRERSMIEANRIQRDYRSERNDKLANPNNDVGNNEIVFNDERRENRFTTNRIENRDQNQFLENNKEDEINNFNQIIETKKESKLNNDNKNQQQRFVDYNSLEKNTGENIINTEKTQKHDLRESKFVDINGRERRFVDTNTGGEIININTTEQGTRKSSFIDKNRKSNRDNKKEAQEDKQQHYLPQSKPVATSSPLNKTSKDLKEKSKTNKATDNQLDICEEYAHICTCPPTSRRHDVAVFRSCSGTLCFRTVTAPTNMRRCSCPNPESKSICGNQLKDIDRKMETEPNTYTIEASAKLVNAQKEETHSRSASPENTDQEISSLTDLPSEKETTSTPSQTPRCYRCARYSLGEDKSTTSKSGPATLPTSSSSPRAATFSPGEGEPNTTSLSEGEMPQHLKTGSGKRGVNIDPKPSEMGEAAPDKLEQALASISEELARCRLLLQKPKEDAPLKRLKDLEEVERYNENDMCLEETRNQNQSPPPVSEEPSSHALHRAKAKPHIGNGPDSPHVMFTLHIGTVVLSDEAVLNSRNMSLVLTWKFYDQNVAMSHMRPGRVVHFDFSTEYDLKLTDRFLLYLKTEELVIKLCEVNKLDAPLASCSLPLREALLHTNRRADMSLALVAGPSMQRNAPAADTLDTRDEVGVLDLWCMLRAEPRIVPRINKAIARSRPSRLPDDGSRQHSLINSSLSPLIMQLDDDQDEVRFSADLDQALYNNNRLPVTDSTTLIDRGAHAQPSSQMQKDKKRTTNYGYVDVSEQSREQNTSGQQYKEYPLLKPRRVSTAPEALGRDRSPEVPTQDSRFNEKDDNKWTQGETRRPSTGYIINEVPTVIRSDDQMKLAITERSKTSGRKSFNPTLQDKYEQAQSKTRPEAPRTSYGEISMASIPSFRNARKLSVTTTAGSVATGLSTGSITRYWRKIDYKDQTQKATETEPLRDIPDQIEPRAGRFDGSKKALENFKLFKTKRKSSKNNDDSQLQFSEIQVNNDTKTHIRNQSIDITILWLALNEECSAMSDPGVQRLYVAYSFLGRSGAELETPVSLPKPKQYQDKCYFNFKKTFQLSNADLDTLGRMAQYRYPKKGAPNPNECVVFTVVSEPVEDPLGLNNCEDIGFAHLFFGDLIAYSAGSDTYTEVIPIREAKEEDSICGVLSIRVDGLEVVRKCLALVTTVGYY